MRGRTRFGILMLTAVLAFTACAVTAAKAEVMTLGVWLRGLITAEDGTTAQVPVEGAFRVLQGGLERGVIQAGADSVTLTEPGPVVLEPIPETFPAGWDLSGARVPVAYTDGTVTVPVLVPKLEEGAAAQVPAAAAAAAETAAEEDKTPADSLPSLETAAPAADALPLVTAAPTQVPEVMFTPVPAEETTPVPETARLEASDGTGTFRLRAFQDGNLNGEQGVYEKGIEGITVYIVTAENQVVTGGETGPEGELVLPGLEPGTYRIRVSLPEQWTFGKKSAETGLIYSCTDFSSSPVQDSEAVSLKAGETAERGISVLKGVRVNGTVWIDQNANGIMEKDEPRAAGMKITMTGQRNGLVYETYTDENGYYEILHIRPGFYDLTSYAPEGMMFTRYSKTGGKNRSIFTTEGRTKASKTLDLNDGYNELDQNIGFAWAASVSGICFLDANYNGVYDEGDQPFAGVKVTAIKQSKDEEIAVAFSGEDGRYTLSGLRGNTYKIRAVLPEDGSDFTRISEAEEGNHFVSRENRRENLIRDFVLSDGEKRSVNVGAIYYGSISGTVYLDDDFSASLSGGEKIAKGVEVSLLDASGTLIDTKKTTDKGTYSFTRLTPGTYSLRMTALNGYAFTKAGEGNVMLNLTGGAGYSEPITVPLGTDVRGMDAGMIRPGTVKGVFFADRNDNGLQDAGEQGLEGAAVRLMSEEGEAFSAEIGPEGTFLFDAVMPGRYYVRYELPENAVFARTAAGGNTLTGEDGAAATEWFDFATADLREMPLCGGLTLGRIGGNVFRDHDGSGTGEEGDAPLAGAELRLIPVRGDLETAYARTEEDGSFLLENLHPDTYTLELRLPDDLVTARMTEATLPLGAGENSQQVSLTVAMGDTWTDQRIGAASPASLRGRVWLDENNNGRMDEGEQTPEGYALSILDEDTGAVFDTVRTDGEGWFERRGMIPGTFSVRYEMSEEMTDTLPGDSTFDRQGSAMIMEGIGLEEGAAREDLLLGLIRYTSMGGKTWVDRGGKTAAAEETDAGNPAKTAPAAAEAEENRLDVENLAGVAISLLDEAGNTVQTAVTGENGAWRMSGLMPGIYSLRAEFPSGLLACEPDDERLETGLMSVMQHTDGRTGWTEPFELKMGEDQLSLNTGAVLPGTIGDFCWLDENGNGWQDGGELGIPHVKVELVRGGVTVAETETDQYGLYFFREVYPAVYTLKVTAPPEIKPTQRRTEIPLICSSLNETEEETAWTDQLAVRSDNADFNVDLGYALREKGVYPPEYGQRETMDWSVTYTDKSE